MVWRYHHRRRNAVAFRRARWANPVDDWLWRRGRGSRRQNLTATVWSLGTLTARPGCSRSGCWSAAVHLKIDTGMGRLGVSLDEALHVPRDRVFQHRARRHLHALCIFRNSDAGEPAADRKFRGVLAASCKQASVRRRYMDNTAGMLTRLETWRSMVRRGLPCTDTR